MRESKEPGHVVRFGNSISGLVRKGFWHIPEIMGASIMALIGIGLATAGCYRYIKMDGDNREFKAGYVIVRMGDPRELKIKNPTVTEYLC